MKAFNLPIIALAALVLGACSTDGTGDEPVTAAPAESVSTASPTPTTTAPGTSASEVATPAPAKPRNEVAAHAPHIDASAFLNALVESGCQIDKAEYKEVKRGGAIKIVCSKTQDPLSVNLDDL